MRGLLLCILVLLSLWPVLSAQYALEDAIALRPYLSEQRISNQLTVAKFKEDSASGAAYLPILSRYMEGDFDLEEMSDLEDAFFDNPFLSADQGKSRILISNPFKNNEEFGLGMLEMGDGRGSSGASPGMLVTSIADGLAKFLSRRSKQELTLAFFRRFQQVLTKRPVIGDLFPSTTGILRVIDDEIYQYRAYLESLRNAFTRDLKILPMSLRDYLTLHPEDIQLDATGQLLAEDALTLSQLLIDGTAPIDVINYLGTNSPMHDESRLVNMPDTTQLTLRSAATVLRFIHLFSESLRTSDDGRNWISPLAANRALQDPYTLYLYLGLLWQQTADETIPGGQTFGNSLRPLATSVAQLDRTRHHLRAMTARGLELTNNLDSLLASERQGREDVDRFYRFFGGFSGLLREGVDVYTSIVPDSSQGQHLALRLLDVLKNTNELSFNVRHRHYVSAMVNLVDLLGELLGDDFSFRKDLTRYGTFIATLGEADNSDEVAIALELFALPPGSSTLKKYSDFSVSFNAYTGISYGRETLETIGTGDVVAVSAPLGLGFNWGLGRRGSIGAYVPVIDVGALTAYRFNDSRTSDLPALEWKNIFAPGALLIYGWGNDLPITLGFGAQRGPQLRKINTDGVQPALQLDAVTGWRWLFFVSVDIPVAHFYNR